jgi:hemerythrin
MVLIKLEDTLKLDIPEIDSQHETLIMLINLLHETMLQGAGKAALDEVLSKLLEHTQTHFAYEEKLMSQKGYPGYESHKSEHDNLTQHLMDLITRYKNGELLLSFGVVLELKGWALVHIEKSDKALGTFLNKETSYWLIVFQQSGIIEDAVSPHQKQARTKSLVISINNHPELPDWFIGDPWRLRQILVNLLAHVIILTQQGEKKVKVQQEHSLICFSLMDTSSSFPANRSVNFFMQLSRWMTRPRLHQWHRIGTYNQP